MSAISNSSTIRHMTSLHTVHIGGTQTKISTESYNISALIERLTLGTSNQEATIITRQLMACGSCSRQALKAAVKRSDGHMGAPSLHLIPNAPDATLSVLQSKFASLRLTCTCVGKSLPLAEAEAAGNGSSETLVDQLDELIQRLLRSEKLPRSASVPSVQNEDQLVEMYERGQVGKALSRGKTVSSLRHSPYQPRHRPLEKQLQLSQVVEDVEGGQEVEFHNNQEGQKTAPSTPISWPSMMAQGVGGGDSLLRAWAPTLLEADMPSAGTRFEVAVPHQFTDTRQGVSMHIYRQSQGRTGTQTSATLQYNTGAAVHDESGAGAASRDLLPFDGEIQGLEEMLQGTIAMLSPSELEKAGRDFGIW